MKLKNIIIDILVILGMLGIVYFTCQGEEQERRESYEQWEVLTADE